MLFNKQIKVSNKFGENYINDIIECLKTDFVIEFLIKNEVEMDLVYFDYKIDGKKVSFLSEGVEGTFIIGKNTIVNRIIDKVSKNNGELFELIGCNR